MWPTAAPATWVPLAEVTRRSPFAQKAGQGPRTHRYLCRACDVEWHALTDTDDLACWLCGKVDDVHAWCYGTYPWAYELKEATT